MKRFLIACSVVLGMSLRPAIADTIHVPGDYPTIQAGIDASSTGDMVIVADGTYTGNGNRDLDFGGRNIHLRSQSLDPALCIIDCQASEADPHRGFFFQSGETNAAIVEGFTVRNGFVTSSSMPFGGGIICNGGSPTIENCAITNCMALGGGGILLQDSTSVIRFCTISDNIAKSIFLPLSGSGGGGILINRSSASLQNCTIARNRAEGQNGGGGVLCLSADTVISDCVISDNTDTAFGGGVRLFDGRLERCVIVGNEALDLRTPDHGFGGGVWAQRGEVVDCVISGNSAANRGGGIQSNHALVVNSVITSNHAPVGGGLVLFNTATAINCVIFGNSADDGGGVALLSGTALVNSTIVGNTASSKGGGLLAGGFFRGWPTTARVDNCILYGNGAPQGAQVAIAEGSSFFAESSALDVTYGDVAGGEAGVHVVGANATLNWGPGNIDADPLFGDPGSDDYRLSAGSPGINAGDPDFMPEPGATDLDGHARVLCDRVDMGAYEFGIGDYDCDQHVVLFDFAHWAACVTGPDNGPYDPGCEAFDFDADLDVDFEDFRGFQLVLATP